MGGRRAARAPDRAWIHAIACIAGSRIRYHSTVLLCTSGLAATHGMGQQRGLPAARATTTTQDLTSLPDSPGPMIGPALRVVVVLEVLAGLLVAETRPCSPLTGRPASPLFHTLSETCAPTTACSTASPHHCITAPDLAMHAAADGSLLKMHHACLLACFLPTGHHHRPLSPTTDHHHHHQAP
jgi:hypothetical protein